MSNINRLNLPPERDGMNGLSGRMARKIRSAVGRVVMIAALALPAAASTACATAKPKGEGAEASRQQLDEAIESNDQYGVMSALIRQLDGYGIGLQGNGDAIACHTGRNMSLTRTAAAAKARQIFAFAHNNPKVRTILEKIGDVTRRIVFTIVDASGIQTRFSNRQMANGTSVACARATKADLPNKS